VSAAAVVLLLSLCSAVSYGVSDFVGGVLSRSASPWAVAAAGQATAAALVVGAAASSPGDLGADLLLWGVLAGLGNGAGNVFLYRGLGGGRMAVVAPLSAIAAAGLPVLVGLLGGERPGLLPLAGVLAALPAIWLVSGGGPGLRRAGRADVVNGLAAGLGFGVTFAALGQVPASGGLAPLAVCQVVSVASIAIGAAALSAPWVPRDRSSRLGAVAGLLAGAATVCYQLAAQRGLLSVASVVASMYPAVTVVLAAIALRERIGRAQGAGLALAAAAVALIASG
jgi:drug/metabolite transporter (DMT)-like permease